MFSWLFSQTIDPQFPLPAENDILLCRFPEDNSGNPGNKPRPVLVERVETGGWIVVSYGTSKRPCSQGTEFVVYPDANNGLDQTTKFDRSRKYRLPMTWDYFQIPRGRPFGKSPKIGRLTGFLNALSCLLAA